MSESKEKRKKANICQECRKITLNHFVAHDEKKVCANCARIKKVQHQLELSCKTGVSI